MHQRPAVLATVFLFACAHGAPPYAPAPSLPARADPTSEGVSVRLGEDVPPPSQPLEASIDRVWAALPAVYAQMGIKVTYRDSTAYALGNRRFTDRQAAGRAVADLVRCGHQGAGPSAVSGHRITLSIVTSLRAEARDRTTLVTAIRGTAEPVEGTSTSRVRCVSNGDLESRVYQLVAARIKT